jgi:SAM-dependent methyltransferase
MDFGYSWLMTYGHLVLAVPAGLAAAWLARRRRARRIKWLLVAVAVWATAAFFVAKFGFRLDMPVEPPTSRFLASGSGRVLDMGCGSGRATIGVLLARPETTVVGLDNWSADYIRGNGPDLLQANARAAGVGDRISAESADMRALPFDDASFDAVISAYAIDHLSGSGIDQALAEAARVLRPGGDFLLMNMHPDAWMMFAYSPLVGLHAARSSQATQAGSIHGTAAQSHQTEAGGSQRTPGSEAMWRARIERAGLEVIEIGRRPATIFFLARKPGSTTHSPS